MSTSREVVRRGRRDRSIVADVRYGVVQAVLDDPDALQRLIEGS